MKMRRQISLQMRRPDPVSTQIIPDTPDHTHSGVSGSNLLGLLSLEHISKHGWSNYHLRNKTHPRLEKQERPLHYLRRSGESRNPERQPPGQARGRLCIYLPARSGTACRAATED